MCTRRTTQLSGCLPGAILGMNHDARCRMPRSSTPLSTRLLIEATSVKWRVDMMVYPFASGPLCRSAHVWTSALLRDNWSGIAFWGDDE